MHMHALVHSINYNVPQFSDHLCYIFLTFQIDPVTIMYLDYIFTIVIQSWDFIQAHYYHTSSAPSSAWIKCNDRNRQIYVRKLVKTCACMYVYSWCTNIRTCIVKHTYHTMLIWLCMHTCMCALAFHKQHTMHAPTRAVGPRIHWRIEQG